LKDFIGYSGRRISSFIAHDASINWGIEVDNSKPTVCYSGKQSIFAFFFQCDSVNPTYLLLQVENISSAYSDNRNCHQSQECMAFSAHYE
jgi:hypothetical protein